MRPLLDGGTLGGRMVEHDPNLLRGSRLLLVFAAGIGVLLAYVGCRDHFTWYAHALVQLIPLSLTIGAILELTGWSSAYRARRTLRWIQASPVGSVCWTRRRASAYLSLCGTLGFGVGIAWLSYTSNDVALGVAAAVILAIAYFVLVISLNRYVLSVHSGRLTVVYRPLPHPFGAVDVLVFGDWKLEPETARRRGGYAEYALRLCYEDPTGAHLNVKLGVADSWEEVQLLRARIGELITADRIQRTLG